jgi:CHAT domain-containing protein
LSGAEQLLMRGQSNDGRERLDQLKSRLHELEAEVGVGLQASHPMLSMAALQPVDLESLKGALSEDEALFGFQLGEQASYLWALTTTGLEWYRLPSGPKIAALAREFRDAVSRSPVSVARERGARLYKVLFGQVSERALAKPDWILMPDGEMFEIPFAALVSPADMGRDRFLVESHSIRSLPSAAMLLDKPAKPWDGPFLGVGDPIYNAADPRSASKGASERVPLPPLIPNPAADNGIELNRLVGSASEVKLSAQAFGGEAEPLVLLGKDANVSRLRSALALRPSVIHLATHVIRPPTRDDDVWIALSRSTAGGPELLGGHTLAGWESHPLLVVMSGCYSGAGAVIPGEGLLGLTRAWIRSGARSVAATLWPATDTHGELLRRMYSYVSYERPDQITPAKALQLAQIDMLRSDEWGARPEYWASYFIVSRE